MQGSSRERMKVPADFRKALAKNEKAQTAFERLAPSHKKAYVEAIVEARKEETWPTHRTSGPDA